MEIKKYGSPVLRKKAAPVEKVDEEIKDLVQRMFDAMEQNSGVGLAAPQIGVSAQVFIALIPGDPPEELILINPKIVETEGECAFEEGCLSVPGVSGTCIRADEVVVEGTTLEGKPFRKRFTELAARIVQHEIDHLNGILFIDRLNKAKQAIIKTKLKKLAKKSAKENRD